MSRSVRVRREENVGPWVLEPLLAADVQMIGDAGGKAPQWAERFTGAGAVAGVPATLMPLFARINAHVSWSRRSARSTTRASSGTWRSWRTRGLPSGKPRTDPAGPARGTPPGPRACYGQSTCGER